MTKKHKSDVIHLKGYKCELCDISEWMSKPICLELDHIDGNNSNNDSINLRLLCPNCHSQTSNFRGRNINSGSVKISDEMLIDAIEHSDNIRQALILVGLTPKSGNYKRASKLINQSYSKSIDITNSQYGTCWLNNGKINKKIKKDVLDEYLSLGWKLGRIIKKEMIPSVKGFYWITNGIENKMISSEHIPDNFWKGKVQN